MSRPNVGGSGISPAPPSRLRIGLDDAQGMVTGVLLVALGLAVLKSAGLLTGGVPGLAFLLNYALGVPLGAALLVVNVPFMLVAWRTLGLAFTLKTSLAVLCLSFGVEAIGRVLKIQTAEPLFAAAAGGILIGVGLLVLFRHGASLGGISVVALLLHQRKGWKTGTVQMVFDASIAAIALVTLDWGRVLYSVVGAVAVNLVLLWNHSVDRAGP